MTSLKSFAVPIYGPAVLYSVGFGALLPVVPLVATSMGASAAQAALLVTVIGIGSLVGSVPSSILAARLGERTVIPLAAALGAVLCLGCMAAGNVVVLGSLLALLGFVQAVFTLARQGYLTEAAPVELRARALSTLGGVHRIGMFVGPFAGAAAIGVAGVRSVFVVAAVAMIAAGAVSLRLPRTASRTGSARAGGDARTVTGRVRISTILRDHAYTLGTIGVTIVLISAVRSCRQVAIPLWSEHIGLDAAAASLVYGIANAVDMAVFYPAGRVMDTHGRRAVAVPSMAVMAAGFVALPFTQSWPGLLAASVIIGFGNGIGSGMVMTMSADLSPDVGRLQFLGVVRFLSEIGAGGGPAVVSALTALSGLAVGLWSAAVCAGAAAVGLWWWIPRAYTRFGVSHLGRRPT